MNKYYWANVVSEKVIEVGINEPYVTQKTSGTSMLYDYLLSVYHLAKDIRLDDFVESVRRYDTWEFFNVYNDNHPKKLNDLLYLIGRDRFIDRFTNNPSHDFSSEESLILDVEENRINEYIEKVCKTVSKVKIGDHIAGIVFAEQYSSQLGDKIAIGYKDEIDFVIIFNMLNGTIGYRGIKDDIDLSEFALSMGGGGHKRASGSKIPKEVYSIINTMVFGILGKYEIKEEK